MPPGQKERGPGRGLGEGPGVEAEPRRRSDLQPGLDPIRIWCWESQDPGLVAAVRSMCGRVGNRPGEGRGACALTKALRAIGTAGHVSAHLGRGRADLALRGPAPRHRARRAGVVLPRQRQVARYRAGPRAARPTGRNVGGPDRPRRGVGPGRPSAGRDEHNGRHQCKHQRRYRPPAHDDPPYGTQNPGQCVRIRYVPRLMTAERRTDPPD